jgi:hypothetical protein
MQRGVQVLACMGATALAGFIAGWSVRGVSIMVIDSAAPSTTAARLEIAEAPVVEPRMDAVSERSAVETAAVTEMDAPTKPEALDAFLPAALASHPHYEGDVAPYLEKYAGASVDQMRLAQFALDQQVASERSRISKERMESGRYDTQFVREGEKPSIASTGAGTPTVSFGFSIEPGDGGMTIKTATIDATEYPDFHDLEMEAWWLASQVRHLEHAR